MIHFATAANLIQLQKLDNKCNELCTKRWCFDIFCCSRKILKEKNIWFLIMKKEILNKTENDPCLTNKYIFCACLHWISEGFSRTQLPLTYYSIRKYAGAAHGSKTTQRDNNAAAVPDHCVNVPINLWCNHAWICEKTTNIITSGSSYGSATHAMTRLSHRTYSTSRKAHPHTHVHALLACSDPIAKQVYYDLQGPERR